MKTTTKNLAAFLGPRTSGLRRTYCSMAASLLFLGGAGICDAHSVTVTYQNIWTNAAIITPDVDPVAEADCTQQTVEAAQEFSVIKVIDGVTQTSTYGFLFWDINGVPYTTQQVKFDPICGTHNSAVALYIPLGGGGPCGEPCPDNVLAFSLNEAKLIPDTTPIASASGGWTAGSTEVIPPSTIVAQPEIIAPPPTIGYGKFKGWEVLAPGTGDPISTGTSLSLTAGGEIILGLYGYPDPDPCQPIRAEFNSCMAGDGPGGPLSCAALGNSLKRCMASFGE